MEDHRFPAGRNGLTETSFTNQVPAGWGSPCGFFFPCQQVQAPQFSRPQCHTCPFPLFGPTVDEFWRTPAPYAAPSFPCAVGNGAGGGVVQAASHHLESKQGSHSLRSRSRPGHRRAGMPTGPSWWQGWGSRQRLCMGRRSQGREKSGEEAEKREGGRGGLLQFRAGDPRFPAGRARGDLAPQAWPSPLFGGSGGRGAAWTRRFRGTHGHGAR